MKEFRDVYVSNRGPHLGPGTLCDVKVPHWAPQLGTGALRDGHVPHQARAKVGSMVGYIKDS
jgi:hypothetical protein